jgi:hypothetical protein
MYELKRGIDEKNKQIFILQQNNFYGASTRFLTEPDDNKSTNESQGA